MYKDRFEGLNAYGKAFVERFFAYTPFDIETAEKVCTLLDFCDWYEFEDELTAYMDEHQKATIDEMQQYFDDTIPPGCKTGGQC